MLNAISSNYLLQNKSAGYLGNNVALQDKKNAAADTVDTKDLFANFGESAIVEISEEGMNALAESQKAKKSDEEKLSVKAQSYLENLRKKYGDYNFVVSNDLDAAQTLNSDKPYSVIFTNEELEKMAEDDDYAQKIMGKVDDAVGILKGISEEDLGEGVNFAQLSISIDEEGNMKFFAQLEKLSEEQAERLEAAKEKRAEERKDADDPLNPNKEEEQSELTKILFKSADVEASSRNELLAKISGIDWSKIAEESAYLDFNLYQLNA